VIFEEGLEAEVKDKRSQETWTVEFNKKEKQLFDILYKIGRTPLPPYIKRPAGETKEDKERYQTVYAKENKKGSVAAPTAGLHFTNRMMKKLKNKGIRFEYLTLHVGLGTFAPVKTEKIEEHKMHAEWAEVTTDTLKSIIKAKREGRRVVAVGTTSVRTLEAIFQNKEYAKYLDSSFKFQVSSLNPFADRVDIFIYPGFKFQVVDAMITNFHLPKSTLLMLVSAFACAESSRSAGTSTELSTGKENIDKAYREAIKEKYRFYSYGDSMLIL
jgi:S-adenosylmethionine:tRNA ribosyltransferase-isomerase